MTPSKSPSKRRSETVIISGHLCTGAGAAAFNDGNLESVSTIAFGQVPKLGGSRQVPGQGWLLPVTLHA
jgi:hypothetical protein